MAWKTIADDSVVIKGDRLRIEAEWGCPPFLCPSEGDMRGAMSSINNLFQVESVNIGVLAQLDPRGSGGEITGKVASRTQVRNITEAVKNVIASFWRAYGVRISKVDIETFGIDLSPKPTTTIAIASLAVIILVVFLFVRKFV